MKQGCTAESGHVVKTCAACGGPAQGHFSIHRDGFCIGPEIDLCDECGKDPYPTCGEIWEMIAERRLQPREE